MTHIIGDVLLKQVALSEGDLRDAVQNAGRLGYGNYRDLTPGDYKYQNAHLALRFFAPYGQGRPGVSDCVLNIDLPDVSEQLIGTVTAGWTLFPLTKKFSVAPEVVVYQRNGTVLATGVTRNITTTSFEAALIAASGFVAGDISAIASGY